MVERDSQMGLLRSFKYHIVYSSSSKHFIKKPQHSIPKSGDTHLLFTYVVTYWVDSSGPHPLVVICLQDSVQYLLLLLAVINLQVTGMLSKVMKKVSFKISHYYRSWFRRRRLRRLERRRRQHPVRLHPPHVTGHAAAASILVKVRIGTLADERLLLANHIGRRLLLLLSSPIVRRRRRSHVVLATSVSKAWVLIALHRSAKESTRSRTI